jgi:hypothetical protein
MRTMRMKVMVKSREDQTLEESGFVRVLGAEKKKQHRDVWSLASGVVEGQKD